MLRYLSLRMLYTLPAVWLVVSIVFLLIHFVPGDPILQMLGEGAPAAGVRSAQRRNRWDDRLLSVVSLFGLSFPNFALGPILILFFAIKLGLLPVSGSGTVAHLVLPAITMGGALAAILTRMVRTSMLEELGHDYIRTARAKGLPERTVVYRHALRNAMIPIITVLGLQFGALLAGAIVTEKIFSWPGIGRLTIDAIGNRDYYLVQGCIL